MEIKRERIQKKETFLPMEKMESIRLKKKSWPSKHGSKV